MLNDSYVEQVFRAKPRGAFYVKLLIAALIICIGLLSIWFALVGEGFLIIVVGIALFSYFFAESNLEYDYTFTNEGVEVAAVYNGSRRKEKLSFELGQVTMVVPKDSQRIANESFQKKYDFTSKMQKEKEVAMVVEQNAGKMLVLLELNEKSMAHVKMYAKNKIYDI